MTSPRPRRLKMTAVVTRLVCKGRQVNCLSSTGTVTLGDERSLIGGGDLRDVPRSDRRIKMVRDFCPPGGAEAGLAGAKARPLASSRQAYSTMRGNLRPPIDGDENIIRFRPHG